MQAALFSNNPPPATREPPLDKGACAISASFHLHSKWLLFAKGHKAKKQAGMGDVLSGEFKNPLSASIAFD